MEVLGTARESKVSRLKKDRRARSPVIKRSLCRVCQSPYRDEYERLLLEGWTYRALSRRSEELEERRIDAHSFSTHDKRHFRQHLEEDIEEKLRRSEMADEVVRRRVRLGVQLEEEIETNLELLKTLREKLPKELTSAAMLRETTRLIETIVRMAKELEETHERLKSQGEVPEEMIARDLAQIVEILCPICKARLAEAIGVDQPDPEAMARRVV